MEAGEISLVISANEGDSNPDRSAIALPIELLPTFVESSSNCAWKSVTSTEEQIELR